MTRVFIKLVYLYTFIYIVHNMIYTPSLFVHVRSSRSLVPISLFFPLHPHAWSSGQSTRGVAEVGRKPRLTSWMALSLTDAISVHFPLHFTPHSATLQYALTNCHGTGSPYLHTSRQQQRQTHCRRLCKLRRYNQDKQIPHALS